MDVRTVHSALRAHLAALALPHPIAWEGVAFDPANGQTFITANLLPLESVANTIGEGGQHRVEGIFQVTVFVPFGSGSGAAEALVDSVINHFPRALALSSGGVTTIIIKSWRHAAMTDGIWYKIPVSIRYFANLN